MSKPTKVKPRKPREKLPCPQCGKDAEYISFSGNGSSMGYLCRDNMGGTGCGHNFSVKPTRAERAHLKKQMREMNRHSTSIHKTWHAFCRKFAKRDGRGWRLKGFDLMQAVEKWAEDYPEVQIVGVDDDHHASSSLVLVPHMDKKQRSYWGTTLVYIAQCSGEDPISFFMYPGHLEGFQDAIVKIRRFSHMNGIRRGIP